MTGTFAGRNVAGETFPLVSVDAQISGEDDKAYAAVAHEALYDANPAL
jgi:hypothetical protein